MNLNGPITGDKELDSYLFHIKTTMEDILFIINKAKREGATGSFSTSTKTITVKEGIITSIEDL